MRVLLVNAPSERDGKFFKRAGVRWPAPGHKYKDSKDPGRYVAFPFFLAYTAALLKESGNSVYAIDAVALQMNETDFYKAVKKRSPELTVIETATPTISLDLKYAEWIKKNTNSKIILVGPHASVFPKEMLRHKFIDYVAIGEYEKTVEELVEKLSKSEQVNKVKGLAFKKSGKPVVNKRREIIQPLDQLPFPARNLFPIDSRPDIGLYWDGICTHYPAIKVATSRGCPFNCNYCLWTQVMYPGRKFRVFSAKRVADEIEHVIKKYGAKEIYFDDDTFTGNREHALGICRELKKRKIKIPWSAMCDAIVTTEEMIREMSEAGCKSIMFGLESADPKVLKKVGKPIDLEYIKKVLDWCNKYKIVTRITNCYGVTGDSEESIRKTFEFSSSLPVHSVQVSAAIPYPGTRFYNEVKKEGSLTEKDWDNYDGRQLVSYPQLSGEKISQLAKELSEKYHRRKRRNPRWLVNAAKSVWREFGLKGLLKVSARNLKRIAKGEF